MSVIPMLLGLGWAYMACLSLFVGMARRYIIRPGTLYFLRSADDPNTRLVNDALTRSFYLQLFRMCQTFLGYLILVVLGIGSITYGLKATGSPLLPLRINFIFAPAPISSLVWLATDRSPLLKKYVRQYWLRAFKACASKMRLSSFIMGKHNPKERGHIVYKDWGSWFAGAIPDYTQPKTPAEAKEVLRTTDQKAVFVPDGYHVRAPKFDIATRKYIASLFIPVTKDDIPLAQPTTSVPPRDLELEGTEDDVSTYDQYEVVYRPPRFGTRVIAFLCMLWVFGVILFVSTIFTANLIGRPFAWVIDSLADGINRRVFEESGGYTSLELCSLRLDVGSIALGLIIMLLGLMKYDEYLIKKHIGEATGNQQNDAEEHVVAENANQRIRRAIVDVSMLSAYLLGLVLSLAFTCLWTLQVSQFAFEDLYVHLRGDDKDSWEYHLLNVPFSFVALTPVVRFLAHDCGTLARNTINFGWRLAFEGFWQRIFIPSFLRYFKTFGPVIAAIICVLAYEQYHNGDKYHSIVDMAIIVVVEKRFYHHITVYFTPVSLAVEFVVTAGKGAIKLYHSLSADVKDKYYSKGKTLENVQTEDQATLND